MDSNGLYYAETQYGFDFGAAKITRLFSDAKKGWVTVGLATPKHKDAIQIYITKSGKVRVFDHNGEWKPSVKREKNL